MIRPEIRPSVRRAIRCLYVPRLIASMSFDI